MTRCSQHLMAAVAVICLAAAAATAVHAQQPAPKKPAQTKPEAQKPQFDQYEPSQRMRTRRESCARDEEAIGAYCVKNCNKGYVMVENSRPPRCRSVDPLPPGVMAGPIRKQIAEPLKPPPPPPGGKPVVVYDK